MLRGKASLSCRGNALDCTKFENWVSELFAPIIFCAFPRQEREAFPLNMHFGYLVLLHGNELGREGWVADQDSRCVPGLEPDTPEPELITRWAGVERGASHVSASGMRRSGWTWWWYEQPDDDWLHHRKN